MYDKNAIDAAYAAIIDTYHTALAAYAADPGARAAFYLARAAYVADGYAASIVASDAARAAN